MAYSTFSISKWSCFRGENETLPLLERKDPTKSVFVINGVKNFSYEDIKLRGVDACIADVKRIIKEGRLGKIYHEMFTDVDDQYFSENDYGMLASYFDQFMKYIYTILHSTGTLRSKPIPPIPPTNAEKKAILEKKKIDLKQQIKELQEEVKKTKEEASSIDIESIDADIQGEEIFGGAPPVSLK